MKERGIGMPAHSGREPVDVRELLREIERATGVTHDGRTFTDKIAPAVGKMIEDAKRGGL